MKKYIFVKQSPLIQLAHLYEHIFCINLTKVLRKKNLYIYLDYDIVAKTYYGGLIYLEINVFTNKRLDLNRIVSSLKIEFDDNIIELGIRQLIAEKNAPFGSNGAKKIVDELNKLQGNPWVMIDDLALIDATNIKKKNSPIYIADGRLPKTAKLNLSIINHSPQNNNLNQLIPLFRQLSFLIMSNLEELICDEFGYFGDSNSFKKGKHTCKLTHVLQVGVSEVNLEDIVSITRKYIDSMLSDQIFNKLGHQLRSLSYEKTSNVIVDFEENYEDTLIFIGSKGWKSIATSNNIETLLKQISFEFSYGKQKTIFSLK